MRLAPPPPRRSASAVYATLLAQLTAMTALVIFEAVRGSRLAVEITALGGDPDSPRAQAVVGAVTVFAILVLLTITTTCAAAATYLTWLVRAIQANDPFARPAGGVVAGWFVPVVNLVAPPLLVDRAWRDADPPADQRRRWLALLSAWWLCTLAAPVLIALRVPASAESALTGLGPADLSIVALAALLCAATVREVTRIQVVSTRPHRATEHAARRRGALPSPASPMVAIRARAAGD
ncbi:DUF4328 domain-containing protein [Streptosporangium soli]|nr:DUF4328 domain-containing protein [Streptosporangium sp. KLBMP 9127]